MKATDPRVTFAELQQWPDDGRRYELYDGEVIVVPSPFLRHQRVAMHIEEILLEYERAQGGVSALAPLDIVLSEHNVVQPDVVYFKPERRHLLEDWDANRIPPDLAVEVLSRSTEARDRGRKMQLLARFQVPNTGDLRAPRPRLRPLRLVRRSSGRQLAGPAGTCVCRRSCFR